MERRLAAILAGDVVGYSRLMAEDEAGTYDSLRAGVGEVVVPAVERAWRPRVQDHRRRLPRRLRQRRRGARRSGRDPGRLRRPAAAAADRAQSRRRDRGRRRRVRRRRQRRRPASRPWPSPAASTPALRWCAAPASGPTCASRRSASGAARTCPSRSRSMRSGAARRARRWLGARAGARRRGRARWSAGGAAAWRYGAPIGRRGRRAGCRWLQGAVAAKRRQPPGVAVLPFDNLSGDPAQDYFSDGLTEDIITELARNRELMVIARNSTFAFKDRPTDVREVGAELGAGYVVEGSARRAGDQLRVVAQLIDAEHRRASLVAQLRPAGRGRVRGADRPDRADRGLAGLLRAPVGIRRRRPGGRPRTLRAYDLVLQGRERYQRDSSIRAACSRPAPSTRGRSSSTPSYAAAHAHLGLTYIVDHMDARRRSAGGDLDGRAGPGARGDPPPARPAAGLPGAELRPGRERRLSGRPAGGRAGGRAQPERSGQPDVAGQGAGPLRRLRRGGRQRRAGPPPAPDGPGLLPLRPRPGALRRRPAGGGAGGRSPSACCRRRASATACGSARPPWSASTGPAEARAVMARLTELDPAFSLAVERRRAASATRR